MGIKFISNDQGFDRILKDIIKDSKEIFLEIAFVKSTCFQVLDPELKDFFRRSGKLKILAGENFNITEPNALGYLLSLGAEVKIYKPLGYSTYHPKSWIIKRNNGSYNILIGSSNFSRGAFTTNIEINSLYEGAISDAYINDSINYFNLLWNSYNSRKVDLSYLNQLINSRNIYRIKIISPLINSIASGIPTNDLLKNFVDSWIDIPLTYMVHEYFGKSKSKSRLMRGWYILPNQGLIDINSLRKLKKVLEFILNHPNYSINGLTIPINANGNTIVKNLYAHAGIIFSRATHQTPLRGLFIRREKNYLEKLGLIESNRFNIKLTNLGQQFAKGDDDFIINKFTEIISDYQWVGLKMLNFLCNLITKIPDEKINYDEFNLFVTHAQDIQDLDLILNLILQFRKLSQNEKDILINYARHKIDNKPGIGSAANMNYENKTEMLVSIFSSTSFLDKDNKNNIIIKNKIKLLEFLNE